METSYLSYGGAGCSLNNSPLACWAAVQLRSEVMIAYWPLTLLLLSRVSRPWSCITVKLRVLRDGKQLSLSFNGKSDLTSPTLPLESPPYYIAP